MKTEKLPFLAFAIGVTFMLVTLLGQQINPATETTIMPILTLLLMNEFGLLITAAGSYIGFKHYRQGGQSKLYLATTLFCGFLAIKFLLFITQNWPL